MTGVLIRRGKLRHRHTGRMPREERDRDWRGAAVSQGTPRIYSHYQKLGRGKEGLYPEFERDQGPVNTSISDFQPPDP